jgi:hypothetical protein
MDDAVHCACTSLRLSDAALAGLRARYTGCLCLGCLRQVAASNAPVEVDR